MRRLLSFLSNMDAQAWRALAISFVLFGGVGLVFVFGAQVLMDEDDRELGRVDKLLVSGCSFTLAEICARCRQLGGVPVPAHVDRESYSILSVLGLMPDEPSFAAVELHDPSRLEGLVAGGRLPAGYEILSSSDAHYLRDIATAPRTLAADSVLQPLLKRL